MLSEKLKTRIEHQVDTCSVKFRGSTGEPAAASAICGADARSSSRPPVDGQALPRTVLVQFFPDGQDMIVVAANSGLPTHPGWYFNLKAHPNARVEVEGRTLQVRAEELSTEQAAAFWPRVLEMAPDYARFPRRTDRNIPLLRLIPLGRSGIRHSRWNWLSERPS